MTITLLHPGAGKLQRFADGASGSAETRAVARHLAACPRCRAGVAFRREVAEDARRIPAPPAPPELIGRILAERAAGERVLLPSAEDRRPAFSRVQKVGGAALAAAAVVAILIPLRHVGSHPDAGDALPVAGGGWLTADAYAAQPGITPPVTGIDGTRVRPGRWTYEMRTVRGGRVVGGVERGAVEVRPASFEGRQAWSISDGWGGHADDLRETTVMDARTLRPLHRIARNVGYSHYVVEQWFPGDSVRGTMTAPGKRHVIARRLPARGGPFLAGEGAVMALMRAVRLAPGWRGSLSTLGWGAVESDLAYPVALRVDGEGRIRIPSGTFDCWRVRAGAGPHPRAFWVRKSDQVPILSRTNPAADGTASEWVLVAEQP
jgi:hypothetical protein